MFFLRRLISLPTQFPSSWLQYLQQLKSQMALQEGFFRTSAVNFRGRAYKHRSRFGDINIAHAIAQVHTDSNPTELSQFLLRLDDFPSRSSDFLGQFFSGSISTNHLGCPRKTDLEQNYQYFAAAFGIHTPRSTGAFYQNETERFEYIDIGAIACNPLATTEIGLLVTMEFYYCIVDLVTTYRRKTTGDKRHRLLRVYSKTLKNLCENAADCDTSSSPFSERGFNYGHDLTDSILKLFQFCCSTSYAATKSSPLFNDRYIATPFFCSTTFQHLIRLKSIVDTGADIYTPTWFNNAQPLTETEETVEPCILMAYSKRKAREAGSAFPNKVSPAKGFKADIPHYETNLKIGQSEILYSHAQDCKELVESISRFASLTSISCHTDLGVLLACRRYLDAFANKQREAMTKTILLTKEEKKILDGVKSGKETFKQLRQRAILIATRRTTLRTLALRHQHLVSRIISKLYAVYLEHSVINMPRSATNHRTRFFDENLPNIFNTYLAHKQSEFRQLLAENTSHLFETLTVYENIPEPAASDADISRRPHRTFYKR